MELNNASIESKPTQALAEAMILNRREEKRRSKSLARKEKQALDEGFDHKSSDEH
jgi:glycine cleavage system pyridoxal-binding protein P